MIRVLVVGKIKASYFRDGCDDYARRITRFGRFETIEVPDSEPEEEAKRLLAARGPGPLVLCDSGGAAWTSHDFAGHLGAHGSTSFAIGGPEGLHAAILAASDQTISFGRVTLPHELARLVLVEQIYRGFTILRGHPYHR